MIFWSSLLFVLGVMAFLDSLFNYGDIFRQVNTFMFMLISLGLLIRLRWERRSNWQAKYVNSVKTEENKYEQDRTKEKKAEPARAEKKKVEVG